MVERDTIVSLKEGIHARPAAEFVKAAKLFKSDIKAINGDKEGNAKSILQMAAFARKGDRITIRAEGEDAEEAVAALVEIVSPDGN